MTEQQFNKAKEIYAKHWAKWVNKTFKGSKVLPSDIEEEIGINKFQIDAMKEFAAFELEEYKNQSQSHQIDKEQKITRVEVIDDKGRSYVNWDDKNKVELSYQDNNRTLKIFITRKGLGITKEQNGIPTAESTTTRNLREGRIVNGKKQ